MRADLSLHACGLWLALCLWGACHWQSNNCLRKQLDSLQQSS